MAEYSQSKGSGGLNSRKRDTKFSLEKGMLVLYKNGNIRKNDSLISKSEYWLAEIQTLQIKLIIIINLCMNFFFILFNLCFSTNTILIIISICVCKQEIVFILFIYSQCWVIIYCPLRKVLRVGYEHIYCLISGSDTYHHVDEDEAYGKSSKKLKPQDECIIRYFDGWEKEPAKQYSWKNGSDLFTAYPAKFGQPFYYEGVLVKNKGSRALIRYRHQGKAKFNVLGYCDEMVSVPKKARCGLHDKLVPSICKKIPIKSTKAFKKMQSDSENAQLRQKIMELSQQNNVSSVPGKRRYIYRPPPDLPEEMPSPDASLSDEHDLPEEAAKEQTVDSDGDEQMKIFDNEIQKQTNNNNNRNEENKNLSSTQTKKFFKTKFTNKEKVKNKNLKGAIKKSKQTKIKALRSIQSNSRTQISFSTKYNFCLMRESGMNINQAWNWCKANGFDVGRSPSGCGKWARKGAAFYMRLIATHGDNYKFCKSTIYKYS